MSEEEKKILEDKMTSIEKEISNLKTLVIESSTSKKETKEAKSLYSEVK